MPQIKLIEASVKMPMRKLAESLGRHYNFVDVMIESGWAHTRKHNGNNHMVRHTTGTTAGLSYYKESRYNVTV
jgi:hypothetical protein